MRNVTITLDERAANWARRRAAESGMSLSRFVGEMLREKMLHTREYQKAYQEFLSEKPLELKGPPEPYLSREELHDRALLRRR